MIEQQYYNEIRIHRIFCGFLGTESIGFAKGGESHETESYAPGFYERSGYCCGIRYAGSKPEEEDGIKWTYSKNSDGTITLKGYDKNAEKVPAGELIIPEKYDGYTVSKIGYMCLRQNNDIESVVIPAAIKLIENQAFYQCKNLTNVVLPEGLKELGPNGVRWLQY